MGIRIPSFSYSGEYTTYSGAKYWYIYLNTSGTLQMAFDKTIDVFMVGGGGAGGSGNGASGGGGGFVRTVRSKAITADTPYEITIGKGGTPQYMDDGGNGGRGGNTEAFGFVVQGGYGGTFHTENGTDADSPGGKGGSGGGAGSYVKAENGGAGGSNGGSGGRTTGAAGGNGSNASTRAFSETTGKLYAGGGGGSSRNAAGGAGGDGGGGKGGGELVSGSEWEDGGSGAANTGGGGGGASWDSLGGYGGSGVVIIRSTMPDYLPVYFEGTRLTDIYYKIGNAGTPQKLETLTFNGTEIF